MRSAHTLAGMTTRRDIYKGDGLTRLHDPRPDKWLSDFSRIMQSRDWYGFAGTGRLTYGNFWARWPCRLRPHNWVLLDQKGIGDSALTWAIRRCSRCGSQTMMILEYAYPPERGTL
jgi:hypothetical protein